MVNRARRETVSKRRRRKAVVIGPKPTATGRRAASRATVPAAGVARVATRVQEIRETVSKRRVVVAIGLKPTAIVRREVTHATVLAVVVVRAVRRVRAMPVKAGRLTAIASSVAISARVRAVVGVASAPVVHRRAVMAPR